MSEQYPPPPGWQSSSPGSVGAGDGPGFPAPEPHQPTPQLGPAYVAAHKPGAIPLRPLTLGDIYDAAFKIIRFNPKATVGSAVLVAAVAMSIPVLVTAALSRVMDVSNAGQLGNPFMTPGEFDTLTATDLAVASGPLLAGALLQGLGLILVAGMTAHVVAAATMGRRLSLNQAWAATLGQRWRLVGLTLLLGFATFALLILYLLSWIAVVLIVDDGLALVLYALISIPAFLMLMSWFWVRFYYLPVPALMLESIGVFAAISRGYHLTRAAFWRTFGIGLLTLVIAQIAGSMLATPVSLLSSGLILGGVSGESGALLLLLSQAVTTVITTAFVAPFTTCVTALQYIDLRMRKEAFDVELMQRAGITPS